MQDFQFARGRIVFTFSLKLSSFLEEPCNIFATAHYLRPVSIGALARCLASTCRHPRFQRLQSQPVLDQARAYIEGEDIRVLSHLAGFLGELFFGFAAERLVERGHAVIHQHGWAARRRSEAYDSLALRLPEIKRKIGSEDKFLPVLLETLSAGRTPAMLVKELGLSLHASVRLAKDNWDPIHRKIVYRSDPHSLFHAGVPDLDVGGGGQPPGPSSRAPSPKASSCEIADLAPNTYQRFLHEAAVNLWCRFSSTIRRSRLISVIRVLLPGRQFGH